MSLFRILSIGWSKMPLKILSILVWNFLIALLGFYCSFYIKDYPLDYKLLGRFSFNSGIATWAVILQLSFNASLGCVACAWGWKKIFSSTRRNGNEIKGNYPIINNIEAKDIDSLLNSDSLVFWFYPRLWRRHLQAFLILILGTLSLIFNPWAAQCLSIRSVSNTIPCYYRKIDDQAMMSIVNITAVNHYDPVSNYTVEHIFNSALTDFSSGPWNNYTYSEVYSNSSMELCNLFEMPLGYSIGLKCKESDVKDEIKVKYKIDSSWYLSAISIPHVRNIDSDKPILYQWNYTFSSTNGNKILKRTRNCVFYVFNETRNISNKPIYPIINYNNAIPNYPTWDKSKKENGSQQGRSLIEGFMLALFYHIFNLKESANKSAFSPGNLFLQLCGGSDLITSPEILESKIRSYFAYVMFSLRRNYGTIVNKTCNNCHYEIYYNINIYLFYPFIIFLLFIDILFFIQCIYFIGIERVWRGRNYMTIALKMKNWTLDIHEIDENITINEKELIKKYGHITI